MKTRKIKNITKNSKYDIEGYFSIRRKRENVIYSF